MQGGVVHYLVKPFVFETFRERLERYAALTQRLGRLREASQGDVDHLFSLLRSSPARAAEGDLGADPRPRRGRGSQAAAEVTRREVAERAGISRGTARRYLEYLETLGSVELSLRYGATGRPEHLYGGSGR